MPPPIIVDGNHGVFQVVRRVVCACVRSDVNLTVNTYPLGQFRVTRYLCSVCLLGVGILLTTLVIM